MGRVAGVLTSQSNGWGRIKRSLRRSGVSTISQKLVSDSELHNNIKLSEELDLDEEKQISEIEESSNAALEDAHDSLLIGFEDADFTTQGDILTIQARVEDLDRMIGTIIKSHEGFWGEKEKDLLLRLAVRRGWPLSNDKVKQRLSLEATNIAEIKGAEMGVSAKSSIKDSDTIERVRGKLSMIDNILANKEK